MLTGTSSVYKIRDDPLSTQPSGMAVDIRNAVFPESPPEGFVFLASLFHHLEAFFDQIRKDTRLGRCDSPDEKILTIGNQNELASLRQPHRLSDRFRND